jgi:hypothetical protein
MIPPERSQVRTTHTTTLSVRAHLNAAERRAQRLCSAEERRAAVDARRRRALPLFAAGKITLANVPPILAAPPASNLIAFSGNVLKIRTECGRDRGKTRVSYEKMSERDVKETLDERLPRIRHDATRASTSEHSRS